MRRAYAVPAGDKPDLITFVQVVGVIFVVENVTRRYPQLLRNWRWLAHPLVDPLDTRSQALASYVFPALAGTVGQKRVREAVIGVEAAYDPERTGDITTVKVPYEGNE